MIETGILTDPRLYAERELRVRLYQLEGALRVTCGPISSWTNRTEAGSVFDRALLEQKSLVEWMSTVVAEIVFSGCTVISKWYLLEDGSGDQLVIDFCKPF